MMQKFDLIVIGGGPGGYTAAVEAARKGLKAALVEKDALGGTCLNHGCIPTKTLLQSAELFWNINHGRYMGIQCENAVLDWTQVYAHKDEIVETLRTGVENLLEDCGIDVYFDMAQIIVKDQCGSENENMGERERRYREHSHGYCDHLSKDIQMHYVYLKNADDVICGKNVLIAAGTSACVPTITGMNNKKVYISKDMLLNPPAHMEKLLIIGGGVIGIEFAFIFGSAGCDVVVLEAEPVILPGMDRDIGQRMKALLKKRGVKIVTNAKVVEIYESSHGDVNCRYDAGGTLCFENGDAILLAAGRKPEIGGLFINRESILDNQAKVLKAAKEAVKTDGNMVKADQSFLKTDREGYIVVDESYETSIPGIYAIGDVIGGLGLAHGATAQARNLVNIMCGKNKAAVTQALPSCLYTVPEAASVGMTEECARAKGLAVAVRKYSMSGNGKSVLAECDRGFMKVIIDKHSRKILGAHLLCGNASDLISQFTQAMVCGLTVDDMAKVVYPHPTFAEGIGEMLH